MDNYSIFIYNPLDRAYQHLCSMWWHGRSCQVCDKLQVSSLSSSWAVTKEHHPLEPGIKLAIKAAARPVDSNSRTVQLMTCDLQTHLSSNHTANLLDPKPKEFMVFQRNMIFALTVSHSFNPKTDKELKFLCSHLSWDQALWWKEITGNPSLGPEVSEAETRHPKPALRASGKIPSHHCPRLPVSCCLSVSNVSTVLTTSTECVWEGKRHGREPADVDCWEFW